MTFPHIILIWYMDLIVKVVDIKGDCPVYEKRDSFLLVEGYKLKSEKPVCMHSLSSILPYYNALSRGIKPSELSLGDEDKLFVQCLDPVCWTGGGTVVFSVSEYEQ